MHRWPGSTWTRWESLQRSPDLIAGFKGRGKGKKEKVREGRDEGEREGRGRQREGKQSLV